MLVDEAVYLNGERTRDVIEGSSIPFTWIGLAEATEDELKVIQSRFNLNPLAVEDALSVKQRPKLDTYRDHCVLVLKTISYDTSSKEIVVGDVTVIFSANFVITVRHGEAIPLRSIRAELEKHPDRLAGGTTAVLHVIVDRLIDQYLAVCTSLAGDVEKLEDSVFDDNLPESAEKLYKVKRELIEFRRAIIPLVPPVELLANGKVQSIDPESATLFSDVRDHLLKVIDEVELMHELLNAALQYNSTLIQTQQNSDMRKISAWVGIAAVPTMVAGIYGMNFKYLPELEWRYGYFAVIGLLVVVSGVLFRLFHKNKWL